MKRIIDGKTYNTETATRIAAAPRESGDPQGHDALYLTRHGALFRHTGGSNSDGDYHEQLIPLSPSEAQTWLEEGDFVAELEKLFGEQPEAGEAESRITLRVPDTLKARIEASAAANKQSLNAWIMRCLETCANAQAQAQAQARTQDR